jgi:NADPH:quinone reductase-like Zn-dependent oxidoreductase
VRRFKEGDKVWAYEFINPNGGFYAEYVTVNAAHVGHVPRDLDLLDASAAAVTGLTALQGIDDHLEVRNREIVLVFGASGAVGTLAVQFAKRCNAFVIGTARGRNATSLVRSLGADAVIDPTNSNDLEKLYKLAPEGLDAVLALAGGDSLERCVDLMHPDARVAWPNGVEPEPRRRAKIKYTAYDAQASPQHFTQLERAAEDAQLQVPIAAAYPLAQAAKAHARLEKGHVLGRIALRIRK